jgi:hypothetical protein
MVLAEMEPTILGMVQTNLEPGKMTTISSPSRVPCQGNMFPVLLHLRFRIILVGTITQISMILPVFVVASKAMLKMLELECAVARLRTMSWVDPGGLDTRVWST